jgi:hypothetical protein
VHAFIEGDASEYFGITNSKFYKLTEATYSKFIPNLQQLFGLEHIREIKIALS